MCAPHNAIPPLSSHRTACAARTWRRFGLPAPAPHRFLHEARATLLGIACASQVAQFLFAPRGLRRGRRAHSRHSPCTSRIAVRAFYHLRTPGAVGQAFRVS
eukprot:3775222-Pyramimonas_sp.AAC.1